MASNKLYSQKEIKALLQKATELQKKSPNAVPTEEGLTLEELEQIAKDSGIDPSYIRKAISVQGLEPTSESKFHLLGAPLSLEIGREVPHTLSDGDWEMVVQEARKTFQKSGGTVQRLGNSLEWLSPDKKFVKASLTASPIGNKTRFFVITRFGKVAFLSFYLTTVTSLLVLAGGSNAIDFTELSTIAITLISFLTLFSATRFVFKTWVLGPAGEYALTL